MASNQVVKKEAQGKVVKKMKNEDKYFTRRPRLARSEAVIGCQKHEDFGGMKERCRYEHQR
jgi:hypothetical protein